MRNAARAALLEQHQQASIVESLGRSLLAVNDRDTLADGTAVLAQVADQTAVPFLQRLLGSSFPEVNKNVTCALYRVQTGNAAIVGELQNILASESEAMTVRINAARAIGRIRLDIPALSVWQTLLEVVKLRGERNGALRWFSITALGELGAADSSMIETLTNVAVRDPDQALRREAVTVLGRWATWRPWPRWPGCSAAPARMTSCGCSPSKRSATWPARWSSSWHRS